ncbi:hypothetical protein QIU19_12915 [Capnocytophaga canimorsus]|nr:hypothetical protein [Capnocytophaga canimorsus]WGU69567.1 hypothetical protein QIU19_12915 [Capnocytophaga canimorsus]
MFLKPQVVVNWGGSLGGLAAMAGVNLGKSSSEDIPPTLYPKLVKSIPFKRKLLQTPLYFETLGKSVSYQEYYWQYAKPSTLDVIKKVHHRASCIVILEKKRKILQR